NQIDILKIANEIKLEKVIFRIIYSEYDLNYLNKLKNYIKDKKITNVELVNSKFIDLKEEIKKLEEFVKEELRMDEDDLNWLLTKFKKIENNRHLLRAIRKLNRQ
ncbi:MAG: hypothetical protein ACPGDB_04430, partial [Fusobacterium sp.]